MIEARTRNLRSLRQQQPAARARTGSDLRDSPPSARCSNAIPAGSSGCFSNLGCALRRAGSARPSPAPASPIARSTQPNSARVAGTVLHGGIAAIARPRPLGQFDAAAAQAWARDGKPLLILDGVGNPHNLGAIARTAAFFGIERMLLADRPDQALPSDASYRVAEGGLEYVTLYKTPLAPGLAALRPQFRIVGAGLDSTRLGLAARPAERRRDLPPALILGNEESGLDPATRTACDEIVTIPGSGRVQSLNVAAAAAILIYVLTRR